MATNQPDLGRLFRMRGMVNAAQVGGGSSLGVGARGAYVRVREEILSGLQGELARKRCPCKSLLTEKCQRTKGPKIGVVGQFDRAAALASRWTRRSRTPGEEVRRPQRAMRKPRERLPPSLSVRRLSPPRRRR